MCAKQDGSLWQNFLLIPLTNRLPIKYAVSWDPWDACELCRLEKLLFSCHNLKPIPLPTLTFNPHFQKTFSFCLHVNIPTVESWRFWFNWILIKLVLYGVYDAFFVICFSNFKSLSNSFRFPLFTESLWVRVFFQTLSESSIIVHS